MTNYSVKRSKDDTVVEVKGHSGYNNKGYDIVCAGISMATTFTANLISRLKYKYELLDLKLEEGYFRLQVKNTDRVLNEIVDNLIETLDELWYEYPGFIKRK